MSQPISDAARQDAARQAIKATQGKAPDLVLEIEHGGCGGGDCTRGPGKVSIAVTWLDPASNNGVAYRADIHDAGHLVCGQIVQRASARLTLLASER